MKGGRDVVVAVGYTRCYTHCVIRINGPLADGLVDVCNLVWGHGHCEGVSHAGRRLIGEAVGGGAGIGPGIGSSGARCDLPIDRSHVLDAVLEAELKTDRVTEGFCQGVGVGSGVQVGQDATCRVRLGVGNGGQAPKVADSLPGEAHGGGLDGEGGDAGDGGVVDSEGRDGLWPEQEGDGR